MTTTKLKRRRILIVDDENLVRWSVARTLKDVVGEVVAVDSGEDAVARVRAGDIDLILLDLRLPGISGMEALRAIRALDSEVPVIMITAHGATDTAVEAMRLGAYDYVNKPFNFDELIVLIEKALSTATLRRRAGRQLGELTQEYSLDNIIGDSPVMREMRELARRVAASSDTTVLLLGETGTGKDLLARAIHYASGRRSEPFVSVNVAAIPLALFASELFGRDRGAYTDARDGKKGLVELSDGGSLYLDEIGDLHPPVQISLLHLVENRRFRHVGGVRDISVDVRVIAASNRDLEQRIAGGQFREDLYYRLQVMPLTLPPLRERGDDILLLARHFLKQFETSMHRRFDGFTGDAEARLRSYHWPGNVRELKNAIERAVLLEDGRLIGVRALPLSNSNGGEAIGNGAHGGHGVTLPPGGLSLEETERRLILQALERTSWNQSRAAELLGLGRDALRYRMKKFDLL